MTTQILPLDAEGLDAVRSVALSTFLEGECYAFAIAIHRGTGLPIVGLMEGVVPRHAFAYWPQKSMFIDVRGEHGINGMELGKPFHHRPPYDLQDINEGRLFGQRPVEDATIAMAMCWAELLMPHLPWKKGRMERVSKFCDELEKLCRRHGFWIRSPYPTTKPILYEADDDEDGYSIQPIATGTSYTIDRRLK